MNHPTANKHKILFLTLSRWRLLFIICAVSLATAIASPGKTGVIIHCDTPNIPLYVDGIMVGKSPIETVVELLPGWHRISVFPDPETPLEEDVPTTRTMRDIYRMGRQDVLVEEGEVVRVTVGYRSIEKEVDVYRQHLSAGNWVGFSMVVAVILLLLWVA